MILLTSTSDLLRVITSAAGDVEVHCSWIDTNAGVGTPGRTNTAITTATTTTICGSPAASTQRNVKTVTIRNDHASTANTITVLHTDGTTPINLIKVTLSAGEQLQHDENGWKVLNTLGAVKQSINQGGSAVQSGMSATVLAADVTNNNGTANTIADVTGLSFPVVTGKKYFFRFLIQYTAAATTTGSRWAISGPGGTMRYRSQYSLTTTSDTFNTATAHDIPAASNASSAATAGNIAIIEGFYEATADGAVVARFASEIASSAIVAKAGSIVYYQEVL